MLGRFGPYELAMIAVLLIIVALVAFLIFRDARKRGISDSAALIFVLLTVFMFPLGLLLYFAFALGKGSQEKLIRGYYEK
jgi:hypothetical protein